MKSLLLSLLLLFHLYSHANTYYFSASGSDNNSGTDASSPYQTLQKLNTLQLNAGDIILFKRGDVFFGSISVKGSGTPGSPITYGAYGSGANPVITGLKQVQLWVSQAQNIWTSNAPVSSLDYTNMVIINGVSTPMGRFPNNGYFLYSNATKDPYTITSHDLTASGTDWTGAELVANNTTYTIIRNPIISQSGDVLTFTHNKTDLGWQKAPGYLIPKCFIQNSLKTLDVNNEWYFDPNTKKISIYSNAMPSGVQVSAIENLINITAYGRNYIMINDIDFCGANSAAIEIHTSKNITINSCNFTYSGVNGIHADYGANQDSIAVTNCTFSNTNSSAIRLSLNCTNAIINNNTITNTGMIPGMMQNGGSSAIAINATGTGSIISNNNIDSTGYNGIQVLGNNTQVYNNYVKDFCMQLLDGAGIYTYNGSSGAEENGLKIYNNIVLFATNKNEGIYLDDKTNNAEVFGNTIAYCSRGIYLHNTWNVNVHNNTCFANSDAALVSVGNLSSVMARNNTIYNNFLVAKNSSDKLAYFESLHDNEITSDSNYLLQPSYSNIAFQIKYKGAVSDNNISQWQSAKGQDTHSHQFAKKINNVNDLRLEYNPTSSAKTINLDENYSDASGKLYNGSVTLQPHTSIVLIKKE